MERLDPLVKAWDAAHWELGEAFSGLGDVDLWVRPHPRLLSVGELAMHVAYWESENFTGGALATLLRQPPVRYYSVTLSGPPQTLPIGAQELYQEVERVHRSAVETVKEGRDPLATNPFRTQWTWQETLEYAVFHVAYHTGQIYAARHLMGHITVDN